MRSEAGRALHRATARIMRIVGAVHFSHASFAGPFEEQRWRRLSYGSSSAVQFGAGRS
jgi:hypothetical protein